MTKPQNPLKRKYIKSGNYTKEAISRRKISKLVSKFNKIKDQAKSYLKEEKSWYEKIKESITNLFFEPDAEFVLDKEALSGITKRYVIDLKKVGLSLYDPLKLLEKIKPLVFKKFKENPITKQQSTLQCGMKKIDSKTGEIEIVEPHFHSFQQQILEGSNFEEIIHKFEKWISHGSNWQFEQGLKIYLNINKTRLLKGSSYIPLPKKLRDKKAIINPKNDDKKCLLWCVAIHELLKENPNLKHPERLTKIVKKKIEKFNTKGMKFPCGPSDIDKFENNNNIPINEFGYNEKEGVFPMKISDKEEGERVNILLIGNKHFYLIKNKSRLFSYQCNKQRKNIHL